MVQIRNSVVVSLYYRASCCSSTVHGAWLLHVRFLRYVLSPQFRYFSDALSWPLRIYVELWIDGTVLRWDQLESTWRRRTVDGASRRWHRADRRQGRRHDVRHACRHRRQPARHRQRLQIGEVASGRQLVHRLSGGGRPDGRSARHALQRVPGSLRSVVLRTRPPAASSTPMTSNSPPRRCSISAASAWIGTSPSSIRFDTRQGWTRGSWSPCWHQSGSPPPYSPTSPSTSDGTALPADEIRKPRIPRISSAPSRWTPCTD